MTSDAGPRPPGRLGRAAGRTFHSLRHRNYRLFFTGQLISNTGNWLTIVALTLLVLNLTDSGVAVGFLSACQFGPILVPLRLGGGGRRPERQAAHAAFTQSLEMAQSFGLAVLASMPHPPLGALLRARGGGRRPARVRQPAPAVVRQRDGAGGGHPERRGRSTARS